MMVCEKGQGLLGGARKGWGYSEGEELDVFHSIMARVMRICSQVLLRCLSYMYVTSDNLSEENGAAIV